MYKSVIKEGKYLVIVADGVFDSPIMELPTEELADKVAFELQTAWDQGESWGALQMRKELDRERVSKEISEIFFKAKSMSQAEREVHKEKKHRRQERVEKVQQARRWQSVLSWKKHDV
ncbi:hypothetical protein [Paenibacillus aestuarii]|uniref:PPM-type phosphatase domain-containing protein n=1 Tax=Paenibacillus aestuarii TaxID=516965 RepID=A0ABW0KBF9_9BACL|nr:hypothetical protein [Paenibacillus aestuarii]